MYNCSHDSVKGPFQSISDFSPLAEISPVFFKC